MHEALSNLSGDSQRVPGMISRAVDRVTIGRGWEFVGRRVRGFVLVNDPIASAPSGISRFVYNLTREAASLDFTVYTSLRIGLYTFPYTEIRSLELF